MHAGVPGEQTGTTLHAQAYVLTAVQLFQLLHMLSLQQIDVQHQMHYNVA